MIIGADSVVIGWYTKCANPECDAEAKFGYAGMCENCFNTQLDAMYRGMQI